MPEQYIITGTITPTAVVYSAGIKVQAFDRALLSLDRRAGSAPQMVGEAFAAAEGGFHITYTLEQFQRGEGMAQFCRVREKNADFSFRVFNRNGLRNTR